MFKLLMSHTELQDLYWTLPEFSRLVVDGTIIRPEVWRIVLRVKLFNKRFYIPLCGIKE
jgi:hypothetical protein